MTQKGCHFQAAVSDYIQYHKQVKRIMKLTKLLKLSWDLYLDIISQLMEVLKRQYAVFGCYI